MKKFRTIMLILIGITTLWLAFLVYGTALQEGVSALRQSITAILQNPAAIRISLPQLLLSLLALLLAAFIYAEIRHLLGQRLQSIPKICPRCQGPLRHIHRTWFDHLLTALLLPDTYRYRCLNPNCQWSGLRSRYAGSETTHEAPRMQVIRPIPVEPKERRHDH